MRRAALAATILAALLATPSTGLTDPTTTTTTTTTTLPSEVVKWSDVMDTCTPVYQLAFTREHACALRAKTHYAVCWGDFHGYVSQETQLATAFAEIEVGWQDYACGITEVGRELICWGGDVGFGSTIPRVCEEDLQTSCTTNDDCNPGYDCIDGTDPDPKSILRDMPSPLAGVIDVSFFDAGACALKSDHTVVCWGDEGYTTDGDATCHTSSLRRPPTFAGTYNTAPAGVFTSIDGDGTFNCGVHTNGSIGCWGNGSTSCPDPHDNPYADIPAGTDFDDVSVHSEHACAHRSDNTVACWGISNTYGENDVPEGGLYSQVVALQTASCGIKVSDGTVECWGNTEVAGEEPAYPFSVIYRGNGYVCGKRTFQSWPWCWGTDASYQTALYDWHPCPPPWFNNFIQMDEPMPE